MSRFPAWFFRPMDAGEMHVDPVHDEFFKMQDLADALVRESIQNSLDARRSRGAVRVRFRFGIGSDALPAEAAREYLEGLREHIDAVSADLHSFIPRADEPVPYLLIEDFGTRGLTGNPSVDPELAHESGSKNDFYYFWRNVGRSNKGDEDRGRWGLGKAVFSVASRIKTIFGLTRRADDHRSLLLGQAVLKTHVIDGRRIYPYGFFARFERKNGLPLPIEDSILLERFADDFRLDRREAGLSIVVPYYRSGDDELTFERLIRSAIAQYFYPLTRGDLLVDVEDGDRRVSISSRSISDVARAWSGPEASAIARLTDLTRWSIDDAAQMRIDLPLPKIDRAPAWSESMFAPDTLTMLRERFERGERIAVRAPVHVKRRKGKTVTSHFDVFLERDESLTRPEVHFIRRGITIPDVRPRTMPQTPFRALVVIDHDTLSTFLGDAENPAHSDWSERADRLRTTYEHHAGTLRFIKASAASLAAFLTRPPEGRVQDFLGDLFSVAANAGSQTERRGAKPGDAEGDSDGAHATMTSATAVPGVTIAPLAGGFSIRGTGRESVLRKPMMLELAYRARSGNPLRKHSPFDFDLTNDEIEIAADGVTIRPGGANVLFFSADSPKFQIVMKGFDPRRDLIVRVTRNDVTETELH
jgi:hypothetical protein